MTDFLAGVGAGWISLLAVGHVLERRDLRRASRAPGECKAAHR